MRIRSLRAISSPVSAAGACGETEQRGVQLLTVVDLSLAAVRGERSVGAQLAKRPCGNSYVLDGFLEGHPRRTLILGCELVGHPLDNARSEPVCQGVKQDFGDLDRLSVIVFDQTRPAP